MSARDQNSPPKGPRVFLGYRRSDQGYALALQKDLESELGADAVFMDVERIGGGEKFLSRIQAALGECNTFLALIGPGWLEAATRLHGPEDFVRMEIAAALASGVRIIPVLLSGVQMPEKKDLPADIEELTSHQAEELRGTRWDDDVRNLIEAIRAPFAEPPPTPVIDRIRRATTWLHLTVLAVVLLAAGFAVWRFALKPNVNTNTNLNDNVNPLTPTPVPTPTRPTPTTTPTATPAPSAKCFEELMPEGRWVRIEYGDPDYRTAVGQGQPKVGEAGVVFAEEGHDIGAIRLRYVQSGRDPSGKPTGFFKIVKVIGPECQPVKAYSPPPDANVVETLREYDWVDVQLGRRHYNLRIAHTNDTITALFAPKGS